MVLNMRAVFLCALAVVAALHPQDPASRPTSVASRATTASRPTTHPLPSSPLAGFWELRHPTLVGWLAIGERHLSLHLFEPAPAGKPPFFQSGFRRYRIEGDRLITQSRTGVSNRADGKVLVEGEGLEEARQFQLVGHMLQIFRPGAEPLTFVRIE